MLESSLQRVVSRCFDESERILNPGFLSCFDRDQVGVIESEQLQFKTVLDETRVSYSNTAAANISDIIEIIASMSFNIHDFCWKVHGEGLVVLGADVNLSLIHISEPTRH
eukprot:3631461-Karenia_brevis.AAC.1